VSVEPKDTWGPSEEPKTEAPAVTEEITTEPAEEAEEEGDGEEEADAPVEETNTGEVETNITEDNL
jgi:hypothetical protein